MQTILQQIVYIILHCYSSCKFSRRRNAKQPAFPSLWPGSTIARRFCGRGVFSLLGSTGWKVGLSPQNPVLGHSYKNRCVGWVAASCIQPITVSPEKGCAWGKRGLLCHTNPPLPVELRSALGSGDSTQATFPSHPASAVALRITTAWLFFNFSRVFVLQPPLFPLLFILRLSMKNNILA